MMSGKPQLTAEQQAEAETIILARMRRGDSFTYANLYCAADAALGIGARDQASTYRLADRLIQRERKAGHIQQAAKRGVWLPVEAA